MPSPPATTVLIADDHAIFRQGVKAALEQFASQGIRFAGEAANGNEVIKAVAAAPPNVILMDVHMPELDGVQATIVVKERFPQVSVIGLSFSGEGDVVLAMVNAGCDGYLLKQTDSQELALALKLVGKGGTYFTPSVTTHLKAGIKQQHSAERPMTAHEIEILQLICEGNSSKEIASTLHVSKRTIDTSRENIMRKAGVKNVLALLRYAIKKKIYKV